MTRPKLGQNFLVDQGAIARIVDALDCAGRTVVEIGPGRGALTHRLAARARRLVAVELDSALAQALREEFRGNPAVEILEQDFLSVDLAALISPAATAPASTERLAVIGNLPYYITSTILLRLFAQSAVIDRAVLMMQREVAERLAAQPGNRDYGVLSTTAQMYARVEKLFTLPPGAFSPPPEVYSTVVRLTMAPRFDELGVDERGFIGFLRSCFAQKRKTLANNLKAAGREAEAILDAMEQCGVEAHARAEALPLETLAKLYRAQNPASLARPAERAAT